MKKLLLSTALVAMTATGAAASNFNVGLYGGLAVGASKATTDNAATLPGGVQGTKSADLGGVGGTVGLNFAYDHIMENNLMLGVDLFGAWHNQEGKYDTTIGPIGLNMKAKLKYSFGTAFKFGYMFDKTMAYARIGYINSRFEHTSTFLNAPNATSTKKKNASGLLLGMGVDLPVGEKMALGFSYDFAMYRKQSNVHNPFNTATTTTTSNFKPRMHFVNVALKFKF